LRRDLHCEPELLDRLRYALSAQQRDAEKIQRLGMPRGEFQRQAELALGVGVTAGFEALRAGF